MLATVLAGACHKSGEIVHQQAKAEYLRLTAQATRASQTLTSVQIKSLYRQVQSHPVLSVDRLAHYDPTGDIGFCFGRAMAVHLGALEMGLAPESIRKLFIIGDLKAGDKTDWRFHVTTVVRGEDGWYAIDPFLGRWSIGRPVTVDEWTRRVRAAWDKHGKAFLYLTWPDAMTPEIHHVADAPAETGGELMELSFRPAPERGFHVDHDITVRSGEVLWVPDARMQARHFLMVKTSEDEHSFDFAGLSVNGTYYEFNNYFADLLDSLAQHPLAAAR